MEFENVWAYIPKVIESPQPPAKRWRIVAGFICCGLATNTIFVILVATGVLTTVSNRTAYISRWIPPGIERLWPILQVMHQLRGRAFVAVGYLALLAIFSVVLAVGLWKMNRWAAWITTGLMLFTMVSEVYAILRLFRVGTSITELVKYGRIPSLAWSAVYVLLLWTDPIIARLRPVAEATKPLRREREPLD